MGFPLYPAEVLPEEGGRLADNQVGVVGADIQGRKIRVIYLEGAPPAGHHHANALGSDPVELTRDDVTRSWHADLPTDHSNIPQKI